MRDVFKSTYNDKLKLMLFAALISTAVGVPVLFLIGFPFPGLLFQAVTTGLLAGIGIMVWRLYMPIHSAQIASAAAVCGALVLMLPLFAVNLPILGVMVSSTLVIAFAAGFLSWHLKERIGIAVFFEPRQ